MLLPFLPKTKPPPSITELKSLAETICISDDTILQLLVDKGLVRVYKCRTSNRTARISYSENEAEWNRECTTGNTTIYLSTYARYKYICLCDSHPNSQSQHSVADVNS